MSSAKRKGLGKGLGALISSSASSDTRSPADGEARADAAPEISDGTRLIELDPTAIHPNPHQPRTRFDMDSLAELAESIRHDGMQEPVVVRERDGLFELISGERRVRASVMAGLTVVPAILREVSDEDMLRLGLIENIQREDLNPLELAQAYQALGAQFKWTQQEIAEQVGKKRATVTNFMRLLNLSEFVRERLLHEEISMGHARALLAFESTEEQDKACREVVKKGLSVRQTEQLKSSRGGAGSGTKSAPTNPHLAAIEDELRRRMGTKVRLRANADHRGKIEIEFHNLDELDRILEILRA